MFNYRKYTDKYFLLSRDILQTEGINPTVRYQVFARKDVKCLNGITEAVNFIKETTDDKVKIYALKDGDSYSANEPIMKLEGKAQDLIDLETVYLGIISNGLTDNIDESQIEENAYAIKEVAEDKPLYYFGARHFHYQRDKEIGEICQEAGFSGTSTDAGSTFFKEEGTGTTPHALFLIMQAHLLSCGGIGNSSIWTMDAFNAVPNDIPRTMLNCTFNKEITDVIDVARNIKLDGIRIDTCGDNVMQGMNYFVFPDFLYTHLSVDSKYIFGNGVNIAGVWGVRRALDLFGYEDLKITVSSGFNVAKTKAFMTADRVFKSIFNKPLFDIIGTGSLYPDVTMATSDIVAYKEEGVWVPLSKVGRSENFNSRVERV